MEPVTAVASTIATLIFTEIIKESGKELGKGVSEKVAQLITAIREKFKAVGREGVLTDAEEAPTEENKSEFKTVLEKQMAKDEAFANKLRELVKQLESEGEIPPVSHSVQQTANISSKDIQVSGGDFNATGNIYNG